MENAQVIGYTIYMDMNDRQKHWLSRVVKIGLYILAIYIIFLLGKALWTNYYLRQSIEKLNEQIAVLEEQKKELNNLNLYYQSDDFKELEARRKLGMKRPDEKVLLISSPTTGTFSEELEKEKQSIAEKESQSESPCWQLWWEFFTK